VSFASVAEEDSTETVDLSDNVVDDLVRYVRGNIVGHEEEAVLMYLSALSGWGHSTSFHINTIGQGPPGSGKSLTKNTVDDLLPDTDTYNKTDASSNAILDSREWDLAISAILDEYDKIDRNIIEVLKSSNPEDGGYAKDRNVEDSDAAGGYSPTEVSADAIPWIVLYAPSSKKGGINEELADRALKLHFNNDKHTRRGIGRKEFGHTTTTQVVIDADEEEIEDREAVVVSPQDVANVLSCLPALLSTTHQLTPLKRHLLDAIDETEPMTDSDGTTVTKVQEYLEKNDIPHPTRQTLHGRMDELAEEYYLTKYDSVAGPKGQADAYEKPKGGGELQPPRINSLQSHADRDDVKLATEDCVEIDPSDPFAGCRDPIRDQGFVETVTQFDAQFSGGSVDDEDPLVAAMGPSDDDAEYASSGTQPSDSNPKGSTDENTASQASLSESTDGEISDTVDYTIETDETPANPTQQFVLEQLRDERGNTYAKHHEVVQKMGIVADDENPSHIDLSETVADPDHDLWNGRADLTDDRVISEEDALRELEQAYANLKTQGLVEELTGKENNVPPAMCRLRVA